MVNIVYKSFLIDTFDTNMHFHEEVVTVHLDRDFRLPLSCGFTYKDLNELLQQGRNILLYPTNSFA